MMNYRLSNTTKVISLRLPNLVVEILERRAKKQNKLVSDYLRARVMKELCRSHKKGGNETRLIGLYFCRTVPLETTFVVPFYDEETDDKRT